MRDRNFEMLNDLVDIEPSKDFEARLMAQIEMPDQTNVVGIGRWLAPLAMAASLAGGVFFGTSFEVDNVLVGLGLTEDVQSAAIDVASIADPYSLTFANF